MSYEPYNLRYRLRDLKVGDGYLVYDPPKHFPQYLHKRGEVLGMKFSQRKVDGGRMVKRVA